MSKVHFLSLTSVLLTIFNDFGTQVDLATGFFYENEQKELFLITNWHVVTGRQPQEVKTSRTGAVPTKLTFNIPARKEHSVGFKFSLGELLQVELDLNSADGNTPEWLEHPDLKYKVDVVAIPFDKPEELFERGAIHSLNAYPNMFPQFTPSVMDNVVVIGFPWGLTAGGPLPIFKRGSVASEPTIPHRGLPRFLIDCRTTSSMSGSPIIASHSGIWDPNKGDSVGLSAEGVIGTVENFVGVYSGRLTGTDLGKDTISEVTELGIAWSKDALDQVVNSGVKGTTLDELSTVEQPE